MRPRTTVRQPVIAGVRGRKLSDLLRTWRRQPRRRSPRLFWGLVTLALLLDSALLVLGAHLLGAGEAAPEAAPGEHRMTVRFADNAALWEPLRRWVVHVGGRPRLFESFCREAVRTITGIERFEDNNPVAVVLSWMLCDDPASPPRDANWEDYPFLRADGPELRIVLSRAGTSASRPLREEMAGPYIEPSMLRQSLRFREVLRIATAKREAAEAASLSPLERQVLRLDDRLSLYDYIRIGWLDGAGSAELGLAGAALREAYHSGAEDLFSAALSDYLDASRRALPDDTNSSTSWALACEGWLNDHDPFRQAMSCGMLAAGLLTAGALLRARHPLWNRRFVGSGLLACAGCLGWSATGFFCEAVLHGGPPVSDGRGVVFWAASLTVGLGLVLARLCRDRFLALAGALVAVPEFALANGWLATFPADWPALPDVLAGGVWLNLHVLTLVSAHSALLLAWGVAALALGRLVLAPPSRERLGKLATLCACAIGTGATLLAAGVILGRFCTAEPGGSWRGWDAQAVCALLTLPGCASLLYARRMGWLEPFGLLISSVIAFTVIVLVWHASLLLGGWNQEAVPALTGWVYWGGLLNLSLAVHAALRYYFGRQHGLKGCGWH